MVGTFSGKKSLKALSNKVFRFIQQTLNKRSAIPRHTEIRDILANKICKDIGIPLIK
ncbi:hypothetical protein O53_288 [Microcystis aeruginosa TAIHU98]|jgi:hypothetical protein|uniref:Uncharacterized protein n=1 Tax=Microcystis aeruginosa TAIHU98 TaxID=1134457 RepID=L7E8A0_MICAE|nr:hypothetical protein O53_288 [Microcystis aeruginosa TAIHU98]